MKNVIGIVFRYLTHSDYFNIYKEAGAESGGGGQTYIDFPMGSGASLQNWRDFFFNVNDIIETNANKWIIPIYSIGSGDFQNITIFQRRDTTVTISSQRLGSKNSNRIYAWHPEVGFPHPPDPTNRRSRPDKLVVYLVKTQEGEVWAGWFENSAPIKDQFAKDALSAMLPDEPRNGFSGYIQFKDGELFLDETNSKNTFFVPEERLIRPHKEKTEEEIVEALFEDDELDLPDTGADEKEVIRRIKARNTKAVKVLKQLYDGICQISNDEFSFRKKDGTLYSEAHHLIPLGEDGADSPHNIIIVSPLIHRMLHYANVSKINLSKIKSENTLEIIINDESYIISWHPEHAKLIRKYQEIDIQ